MAFAVLLEALSNHVGMLPGESKIPTRRDGTRIPRGRVGGIRASALLRWSLQVELRVDVILQLVVDLEPSAGAVRNEKAVVLVDDESPGPLEPGHRRLVPHPVVGLLGVGVRVHGHLRPTG